MVNHADYCTEEQCKRLVKAGFSWKEFFICPNTKEPCNDEWNDCSFKECQYINFGQWRIPTWAAIKWLREEKKLFIEVCVMSDIDMNEFYAIVLREGATETVEGYYNAELLGIDKALDAVERGVLSKVAAKQFLD